jgi:signal transduction protein with GAF and PtsI domain
MDDQTGLSREVRALYALSEAINASLSQRDVLAAMLERIVTELGYKAATLRLLDEERQTLELKAAYGLNSAGLIPGVVAVAKSGIDQAVLSNIPIEISDACRDPDLQCAEVAGREGLAGMLAVPLAVRGRVIGVLRVYTAEPHPFNGEERALLVALANLGAQVILRTGLYEAFQTIACHVSASLDLKAMLTALLLETVAALNVKAGSIRLLGSRHMTLHLAAAAGLSATYIQQSVVEVADSPIDQRVLRDAQPLAITELTAETGLRYPEEAQREGMRSMLVLPLRAHDSAIGVLRLYSAQVRRFNLEELAFAATVANLGAIAIENGKLHAALKERLAMLKEDTNGWYRFLALS